MPRKRANMPSVMSMIVLEAEGSKFRFHQCTFIISLSEPCDRKITRLHYMKCYSA